MSCSIPLPLPLQHALRPVMPPQTTEQYIDRLERELVRMRTLFSNARAEEVSLLRLPFKVEVETKPAVRSWGPMGGEAEYAEVTIDDDLVRESMDWLIDKHMIDLERKALELQRMRNAEFRS